MIISHYEMHILYVTIFIIIVRALLHWLKTKQAANKSKKTSRTSSYTLEFGNQFLAIVALTERFAYSPEAVLNKIKQMYPNIPFEVEIQAHFPPALARSGNFKLKADEFFSMSLGGTSIFIACRSKNIRPSDFEESIINSADWPEARNLFSCIVAEVAVTRSGPESESIAIKRLDALKTMIVSSAIAELTGGFGIKWFESELLVKPQDMKQYVADCFHENWPTKLWVSFKDITRTRPNNFLATELVTCGLASFVGREMQFLPANLEFNLLQLRAYSLAEHLINAGQVFVDGQVITVATGERVEMQFADQGYWSHTKFLHARVRNQSPVTLQ